MLFVFCGVNLGPKGMPIFLHSWPHAVKREFLSPDTPSMVAPASGTSWCFPAHTEAGFGTFLKQASSKFKHHVNHFSWHCDEMPTRSNFMEEGFLWAPTFEPI